MPDRDQLQAHDLVNASKIGLTQTVKCTKGGTNDYNFGPPSEQAERQKRANSTEQGDEGRYIDRMGERTNPIYGMDNPAAGTDLGASNPASNAEWGYRTLKPDGTENKKDAWLYDGPNMNWSAGTEMEQIFETTAVAVEGDQAGTYYGSVEWGVRTDATSGTPTLIPFEVVSMGAPTSQFMASAGNWNAQDIYMRDRIVAPEAGTVASVGSVTSGTRYPAGTVLLTIRTAAGTDVNVEMPEEATLEDLLVGAGDAVTAGMELVVIGNDQASQNLPVTSHQTADPSAMSPREMERRMRELCDQLLTMDTTTPDYQNVRFEVRGSPGLLRRRGAVPRTVATPTWFSLATRSGRSRKNTLVPGAMDADLLSQCGRFAGS